MILSTASVAMVLVYLLSFVAADHQPSGIIVTDRGDDIKDMASKLRGGSAFVGANTKIHAKNNNITVSNSKIFLSMADRVQLAQTIKKMLTNDPKAGEAREMSTDDLFGLLTRVATTPGLRSNVAGLISAARDGNTSVVAGLVYLLAAEQPAATSSPPAQTSPQLPPTDPVV